MNADLYERLYNEYGRENVGITRRELTTKYGRMPNYIELLAALALKQGWQTRPLETVAGKEEDIPQGQLRLFE
jgi:hypothetical protein